MLNSLARVRENPSANPSARSEPLEELARKSPVMALERVCSYLAELQKSDLTPANVLKVVYPLDSVGTICERMLSKEYLAEDPRRTPEQANRISQAMRTYADRLAGVYRVYLAQHRIGDPNTAAAREQLPQIICKALRVYATRLKWSLYRYQTIEQGFWKELGDLYRLAEVRHFARSNVVIHRGETTTVQAEFLRATMMAACSPDGLLPTQIEVVDRILLRFSQDFRLEHRLVESLRYVVDLSGSGPRRVPYRPELSTAKRYFGPGAAYDRLCEADDFMERSGLVPTSLGMSDLVHLPTIRATIRHLLDRWSPELKQRHAPRRMHVEPVTVVHEFDEVVANVAALYLETPFVSNEEQWLLEDESAGGYAAFVRSPGGKWITPGSLIALKRDEGASWSAGVVKRLCVDELDNRYVGVEMLAQGGAAVTITEAPTAKRESPAPVNEELCVLLPAEQLDTQQATLLMPVDRFSPSRLLIMRAYGMSYLLSPVAVVKRGGEFEMGRFQIVGKREQATAS